MSSNIEGFGRLKGKKEAPQINERILADRLQVVDETGKNLGVIDRIQALTLAQAAELDLVLIAEAGADGIPVAKIMDFGKVLYAKKKKSAEGKKKQKAVKVKELKFRPKISEHDFQTKLHQGIKFLKEGKRLKMTLMFRGREHTNKKELGAQLFDRIDHALRYSSELSSTTIMTEKDATIGQFWSRVYYLK